ncbi:ornithine--oxo-acid transaminase [candidate division KSB3 bacterium]|uniref:ornithine aminotransferase n=1 Tax=candidate division KSB3 bacterium TaxID=2044937 RepID=A0A2G6E4I8_9BACT|nr:MAG: ornithine--oxo-acid transaminase [candidate division KSB3 bacterium]PIE29313.1 MAG: ornithine--oxo-acid transaminase [candidate division KSB3 bacterium]
MTELTRVEALMERYAARNYAPLPVNIVEGQGCWVWTEAGRKEDCKYLDCLAAYGALNQGYNHPRIAGAALKQIAAGVTVTSRAFLNSPMAELCKLLAELCRREKVLLMNTGAEAVESAIKIARKWGYRVKGIPQDQAKILISANNFHGRTLAIIGFSTEAQYQDGFGPFAPGFEILPYGDIEALKHAIDDTTAAFLTEPIQGEAGIIFPPDGFLREAKALCEERNVLLMADCIQSGFGRSGKLFACDWEDVVPDVYILGKAIGGGYPLSAVVADAEVMDVLTPGDHGSTFGGNPFCSAVALEAVKVIVEEGLVENSLEMGRYFLQELQRIHSPWVREYRGRGLWIGIELHEHAGGARRFCEQLQNRHHILCKETHHHIIRVAPPLTITKAEIDWALEGFRAVLMS